jgi:hypothetical protein
LDRTLKVHLTDCRRFHAKACEAQLPEFSDDAFANYEVTDIAHHDVRPLVIVVATTTTDFQTINRI